MKQNKIQTENISLNPSEMLEGIEELPGQMELEGPRWYWPETNITEVSITFYTTLINLIIFECV